MLKVASSILARCIATQENKSPVIAWVAMLRYTAHPPNLRYSKALLVPHYFVLCQPTMLRDTAHPPILFYAKAVVGEVSVRTLRVSALSVQPSSVPRALGF